MNNAIDLSQSNNHVSKFYKDGAYLHNTMTVCGNQSLRSLPLICRLITGTI